MAAILDLAAILDFRWSKSRGFHGRIQVDFYVCTIWMDVNRFKVTGLCYKLCQPRLQKLLRLLDYLPHVLCFVLQHFSFLNMVKVSYSPHFMVFVVFPQRRLRLQDIETARNQTTSPGDTKVALPLSDDFNPWQISPAQKKEITLKRKKPWTSKKNKNEATGPLFKLWLFIATSLTMWQTKKYST